ncbi:SDR family NAD(P)-dependent oxidoreductase [Pseudonocardia sp. GCM10023141]|uniref:SDR family NAD(P)-dependent oxidoreductase n=1 Tax=Pseudonocardia sp. GCM10023141 TaxID=3252653 RepID=UPI00360AC5D7
MTPDIDDLRALGNEHRFALDQDGNRRVLISNDAEEGPRAFAERRDPVYGGAEMPLPDLFSLDGRVAIVTGSSSGLGVGFATTLAQAGAAVVLAARRVDRVEKLAAELTEAGHRAVAVATDIADQDDCRRVVQAAVAEFGRLDVLVNNAGIGAIVPAHRQDAAEFREILAVNIAGTHWMSLAAADAMQYGGAIVNISSVLALSTASSPQAAYAASKAAILALTRDLAQEWTGRRGIRVNAVVPGFFATEMTSDHVDAGHFDALLDRIPAGRLGEPGDLSGALLYLASAASSYVTGQTVVVDGGFVIT